MDGAHGPREGRRNFPFVKVKGFREATGGCVQDCSDITGGPREGETKDQRLWVAGRFRPPSAPDL